MREPGRVWHKHLHLSHTRSLAPSHFFLLPPGLPAKRAAGLRGQLTAPPRSFPAGRSPVPASGFGPRLGPKPASPIPISDARRFSQPNSVRGSSTSSPRGSRQRPFPPSGRPLPRLQCPVPPGAGTPFPPSPPAALPSGAHLARPPPPARLLSKRQPPQSSRPRPAPGRIQFEAPQDLPGPLVLG